VPIYSATIDASVEHRRREASEAHVEKRKVSQGYDGFHEFGSVDLRGRGIDRLRSAGGVLGSARGVRADASAVEPRCREARALGRAQPVATARRLALRAGVLAVGGFPTTVPSIQEWTRVRRIGLNSGNRNLLSDSLFEINYFLSLSASAAAESLALSRLWLGGAFRKPYSHAHSMLVLHG